MHFVASDLQSVFLTSNPISGSTQTARILCSYDLVDFILKNPFCYPVMGLCLKSNMTGPAQKEVGIESQERI